MSARRTLSTAEFIDGVKLIAARELSAYFDSRIAYVYSIAFAILANSVFMNEFFLAGRVEMRGFFERLPLLFAVFLPAISMRLWAEERRQRTIELLLTLPVAPVQAALGKFLAALGLLAVFLASSLPIVVMLAVLGKPDFGLILAGYLGVACLGALFLAFGMFFSALSGDQITAFVSSALVAFLLVLTGNDKVVAVLDGLLPALSPGTLLCQSISIAPHYDAFVRGSVELPALIYFAGLTAFFVGLTVIVLERNRT